MTPSDMARFMVGDRPQHSLRRPTATANTGVLLALRDVVVGDNGGELDLDVHRGEVIV